MPMKVFAVTLLVVLAALQYRLWVSDDGIRTGVALRASVATQRGENAALTRRNQQLVAEVNDLKQGLAAIEERARNDLGMIGASETFFQVIDADARPADGGVPPRPPLQRTAH